MSCPLPVFKPTRKKAAKKSCPAVVTPVKEKAAKKSCPAVVTPVKDPLTIKNKEKEEEDDDDEDNNGIIKCTCGSQRLGNDVNECVNSCGGLGCDDCYKNITCANEDADIEVVAGGCSGELLMCTVCRETNTCNDCNQIFCYDCSRTHVCDAKLDAKVDEDEDDVVFLGTEQNKSRRIIPTICPSPSDDHWARDAKKARKKAMQEAENGLLTDLKDNKDIRDCFR